QHRLGDVDSDDVKAQRAQELRRTPRPTTEVHCPRTTDMLPQKRGQVAEGQPVRPGKLECGVRLRPQSILVDIPESALHVVSFGRSSAACWRECYHHHHLASDSMAPCR